MHHTWAWGVLVGAALSLWTSELSPVFQSTLNQFVRQAWLACFSSPTLITHSHCFLIHCISCPCWCWSPSLIIMGLKSKKLYEDQSYKKSLQQAIDCAVPFTDDIFRAAEASIFRERSFLSSVEATGKIVWKRPGEIDKDAHLIYREKVRVTNSPKNIRWRKVLCYRYSFV